MKALYICLFLFVVWVATPKSEAATDLGDMGKFRVIKEMNCVNWEERVQQINWMHEFAIKKWPELSEDVKQRVELKLQEAKQIKELCS